MRKYKNSNKTESANEIIQLQEKSPNNEWWDEKCRQAIKQKNITRMTCLWQKTRANKEHYKEKRKEANKVHKQKNKLWLNNKIMQTAEANKRNETSFLKS